ncbi:MAG TPA: CHAT domain-containing tetratricopeptide repeat protein [Thermoanaerobaculia bacterium]|jgi:CHAT domain-containing protein/Tfp pilus assembly protein PilF|nr:CHAT domain-containing tetratricopeptide repeat protein [Thermoanaerobaculia bacterium]
MLFRLLSVRGRSLCGLAALVLSILPAALAAPTPAEAPRPAETLTLGKETQEHPIKAGEAHAWQVGVAPGTAVLVTIDQHSIGLVAEVRRPGVAAPVVFGAGNDNWGPVVLLLEAAGEHRIEVRPRDKAPWPGRYTMRAEAVPSAGARHDALALMSLAGREAVPGIPKFRKQATATYSQALAAWRALGERGWEAEALTCVAILEDRSGDFKPAARDFEAALALWRELADSRREAESLNWLANLYLGSQGPAKTRKTWENALALWQGLGESIEEAHIQSNLCALDRQVGELETALACFQKNLPLFQQIGAVAQEAAILSYLGGIYDDLDRLDEAQASYQQALDLWRSMGDRDGEASMLNNLGTIHRELGEWQEALHFYNQSWEILIDLDDRSLTGTVLNNLGVAYNVLGKQQRALVFLQSALKLYRDADLRSRQIVTLNNLGTAWRGLGNWEKALVFHQQAFELARSLSDVQQQANSRARLAEVHLDRGDPTAALRELDAVVLLLGEKGSHSLRIKTLHLRGRALTLADHAREALPALQQALKGRRELHDPAGEAETLDALAEAERSLGLTADALSHTQEAVDLVEQMRSAFLGAPDLRASFLAARRRSFSLLIDLLMARHTADPGKGYDQAAFQISERARARSLLDALRAGGAGPTASTASPSSLAQRSALLHRLSVTAYQRRQASGGAAEALEKEIDQTLTEIDNVEGEIRQSDPHFKALSAPPPVSPEEVAGDLEPGTMLLEYSLGEERSFLWAIEAGRIRSYVLPSQAKIEPLARRAYQEMSAVESGSVHRGEALTALSRILLRQVWSDRTNGSQPLRRLVVVPDGALALLPFATLPVPNPGRRWEAPGDRKPLLERVEVVSIPSATTLTAQRRLLRDRAPAPQLATVFADPVFAADDPRLPHRAAVSGKRPRKVIANGSLLPGEDARGLPRSLQRLQATQGEAEAIRDLAPAGKVRLDLGLDASREAVLAGGLRDYRILHFATHAVADTESPELSGLVLSQVDAAGRPREGFLGLSDIYDLDLDADLVVLSGCQTALGKEVRGEGLIGLTRGFQFAGVPRVVASLWRVEDRATAKLMTRFYQAMWRRHLAPAAALREAQLWLRRDPRYKNPHSWAGFVLQGEWR